MEIQWLFFGGKTPSFINSIYLFASDFSAYRELMFAGLTGHSYLGDSRQATCKSPLPFDLVHYCNNRLFYSSKPEIHIFQSYCDIHGCNIGFLCPSERLIFEMVYDCQQP